MGYYKLKNVGPFTSISIADWLRKHGHAVRPELSRRERGELEECFRLIDADGSGAIDVDEMFEAFQLLGLRVSKKQVEDMLAEVDADGSGEIEIPEFIEIMTMTRQTSEKQEEEAREAGGAPGKDKEPAAMPLHLLTVAYRRKKMLEGVMYDEGNTREKLIVKGIENEERRQQEKAKLQRAVHAVTGVSTLMKVMHAISHVRSDASGKAGSEKEAGKGDVASVTDREEGDHPDEDEEDLEFKPLSESCPTLRFDADGHFAGMVADAASEKAASEAVTETEGYTWIAPTPEQEAERTQKIVASVRARFADEEAEVQRLAGRHTMQGLSRSFSADQPIPFLDPSQSAVSVDMAMQRLALTRRDRGDPHDRRAMSSMAVLKREGSYRADPLSVTQVLGKFPSLQFREVFELPSVAGADLIASRKLLLNIAQPTPGQPRRSNLDASIRASRPVICRRRSLSPARVAVPLRGLHPPVVHNSAAEDDTNTAVAARRSPTGWGRQSRATKKGRRATRRSRSVSTSPVHFRSGVSATIKQHPRARSVSPAQSSMWLESGDQGSEEDEENDTWLAGIEVTRPGLTGHPGRAQGSLSAMRRLGSELGNLPEAAAGLGLQQSDRQATEDDGVFRSIFGSSMRRNSSLKGAHLASATSMPDEGMQEAMHSAAASTLQAAGSMSVPAGSSRMPAEGLQEASHSTATLAAQPSGRAHVAASPEQLELISSVVLAMSDSGKRAQKSGSHGTVSMVRPQLDSEQAHGAPVFKSAHSQLETAPDVPAPPVAKLGRRGSILKEPSAWPTSPKTGIGHRASIRFADIDEFLPTVEDLALQDAIVDSPPTPARLTRESTSPALSRQVSSKEHLSHEPRSILTRQVGNAVHAMHAARAEPSPSASSLPSGEHSHGRLSSLTHGPSEGRVLPLYKAPKEYQAVRPCSRYKYLSNKELNAGGSLLEQALEKGASMGSMQKCVRLRAKPVAVRMQARLQALQEISDLSFDASIAGRVSSLMQ